MIKKCTKKITDWLIRCDAVKEIERELYEYAVYSIDRDTETVNIFVSRVEKDPAGNDILKDIDTPEEKAKVDNIVKELIKLPL